jgi:hypothetical protein
MYTADDSRDGGGRAKQEARAEARDVREQIAKGWTLLVKNNKYWHHRT